VAGLIVVIFGLMGTGKTTLAKALGQARGWPVVHSDLVRKSLAGLAPTIPVVEEFGRGIYRESFSRKTYAEMLRLAGNFLQEHPAMILDGSYKRAAERERVRQAAHEWGAQAVFIYCQCPKETVRERLVRRLANSASISDGRLELLDMQKEDFDPLGEADRPLLRLDTKRQLNLALADLQQFVEQHANFSPNRV
jgi:predicted kinase